jgi:glycosyltransferase involved in cell wall biosynthesis
MSEHQKRVLMITYAFPPAAYVGAHRTLKYCKYLPSHGWLPVVLTIDSRHVAHLDPALCDQIPAGVKVHRTRDLDPAKWLDAIANARERAGRRETKPAGPGEEAAQPRPRDSRLRVRAEDLLGRWMSRARQSVRRRLTESPDSHVFWMPFALLAGARILLRQRIDVIYCSAPPHSTDVVAYLLGRIFRRPYVLDYRDPWTVREGCAWQRRARQAVIRNAVRVIAISPGERDELRAEFPDLDPARFTYITNGYDPSDFRHIAPAERRAGRRMTVTHAGTIYSGAAGELFDALRQLVAADPTIGQRLEVVLIGEIARQYADAVAELQTAGVLSTLGPQPHAVALQQVLASDVLLILLGGHAFPPSEIPAKTFEYLFAGKPILAVTSEGDLAAILGASGLGMAIPPGNAAAVARALQRLLAEHEGGRLTRVPVETCVRAFDRAALSARLAGLLDAVAGSRQDAPDRRLVATEGPR